MAKRGRKSKYDTDVKPRFDEIKQWLELGCTDKEIYENLGISKNAFYTYKKEFEEFENLFLNNKKRTIVEIKDEKKVDQWVVYKHTFPNGKVYIGITGRDPEIRWANGKGYNTQTYVRHAIDKYGWENIQHEILFENLTEDEAKRKEIELINKYQSTSDKRGYNLTKGGDGQVLTKEQRRQLVLKHALLGTVTFAKNIEDVLDRLETVQKLSKKGMTKDEIATSFGVSRTTWYNWEQEEPCIRDAIELGRLDAVNTIKAALYKRATGFNYVETKVTESSKDGIKKETVTKYALPDPASAMILLKHWAKDEGWTNDPQMLEIRKKELELKEKQSESEDW